MVIAYLKPYTVPPKALTLSYRRHVHMFYGDLISNLFLRQYHSSAPTGICHAPETAGLRGGALPSILAKTETKICSPHVKPLVLTDFEDPQHHMSSKSSSPYFIIPLTSSWEFKEDRKNKYGLTSEFGDGSNSTDTHTARWYVDGVQHSKEYFVHVRYMRTYSNAGVSLS